MVTSWRSHHRQPKLSPGSGSTDRIFGTMDIFDDGTFRMEIEYQYISTDRMNSAVYYVPAWSAPASILRTPMVP